MGGQNDKRHFSRFPIEGSAQLACTGGQGKARLLDISLKGALVSRPEGWPGKVGDHCRLHVALNESDVIIEMEAVIVHLHGEVMGVRCEQIDLNSISHLKRLVELNLGDEELLGRELGELLARHS